MDCIISDCYDGKLRTLYKKSCILCNKEVWIPQHQYEKRLYCSAVCRTKARIDRFEATCAYCGTLFFRVQSRAKNSKSGLFFCKRECKDAAQQIGGIKEIQPSHYGSANGKNDYRQRALDYYGRYCHGADCPLSKADITISEKMLDVHHIDSNRNHNELSNLEVLCVLCHSLKTRSD